MISRVLKIIKYLLLSLFIIIAAIWGNFSFIYLGPDNLLLKYILIVLFVLSSFLSLISLFINRYRKYIFSIYLAFFTLSFLFFITTTPSNNRDWKDNVVLLPYATLNGDEIRVFNIRNFDYKSENEYKIQYYNETFSLKELQGVDLIAVYWMGPTIAHVFLSFSFADSKRLAISIEARNEKGEEYSSIKGFFRQSELYYVVANERDVIGLRTNYRNNPKEDVYIYELKDNLQNGRKLFLEYIKEINKLRNEPTFYNTLTTNCTTNIWIHSHVANNKLPFSWKILLSGYVPEYLFEQGMLENNGLNFSELQKNAYINERANRVSGSEDFSSMIREKDRSSQE